MSNLSNYFTFVDNLNASLKIKINEILLDRTEDFNTISCINSEVDFETYKRIEQEGWFNFKPEIKNTGLDFVFEGLQFRSPSTPISNLK